MKPLRLLAPLAALTVASLAAALDSTAWEFRQTITLDRAGPLRLTLPAETLDAARADLTDLRLLGPDGAEVPFAIIRRNTVRPTVERVPTQARVDDGAVVVEFGLAKAQPLQRLRLETPAPDFIKAATVEVENEQGRWQKIVDSALVFRMSGGMEQLALELRGVRGRMLRVRGADDRGPTIPITAIIVETGENDSESLIELPIAIAATEHDATTTRLTLDLGLRHRAIAELAIEAKEMVFQRAVSLVAQRAVEDEIIEDTLATGTLARLVLPGDRRYAQLSLPVDAIAPAPRIDLVIDNGDSPPLSDLRIVARLRRLDIGFAAPAAGTYTLLAGAPNATAPRYDVAAFTADWGRLPSSDLPAGPRLANPSYRPAQVPTDVPEFGGPIDTAKWRHRREVLLSAPGAQVLELDPTALARSRNDLADLRLVRGDRQVPYLLERSSRVRTTPLALVAAADPKRPSVGRWELAVPVVGMPIRSIRLTVHEPLFSRTVVVGEMRNDSRGQPWPEVLGSATIQRRSPQDPATFTLELHSRPQTGTLFVEIDHGDNAAFAPTKAEASYPVRRLHFRATETSGCRLLYGNTEASAPRYDLQLAAPRLLTAVQHIATLEATARADTERSAFNLGGPAARYAFWGALALVVVVLVWLVAKLLPKQPAP